MLKGAAITSSPLDGSGLCYLTDHVSIHSKIGVLELSSRAVKGLCENTQISDGDRSDISCEDDSLSTDMLTLTHASFSNYSVLTRTRQLLSNGMIDLGNFRTIVLPAIRALVDWHRDQKVDILYVGATATYRGATNITEILFEIEKSAGIPVQVLSEDEEAMLTFKALQWSGVLTHHTLLIDQGGGSTELGLYSPSNQCLALVHLPYGIEKLGEVYRSMTTEDLWHLRSASDALFNELFNDTGFMTLQAQLRSLVDQGNQLAVYGLGSSIKKCPDRPGFRRRHGTALDFKAFDTIKQRCLSRLAQKEFSYGTNPVDAHELRLQIFGIDMMEALMTRLCIQRIHVCGWSLRHGMLQALTEYLGA